MEFIIVLGSPSRRIHRARTERAVQHFKSVNVRTLDEDAGDVYNTAAIIFSGKGSDKITTEARKMMAYATSKLGVSAEVCILEEESMNTYQNISYTVELLRHRKFFDETNYDGPIKFTVCTSDWHVERASLIAQDLMEKYGTVEMIGTEDGQAEKRREREAAYTKQLLANLVRRASI